MVGIGRLRTDQIIGGGDEKNGEIRRKKLLCFSAGRGSGNWGGGSRFMVALGNWGLNNLKELDCRLFLVVGGS